MHHHVVTLVRNHDTADEMVQAAFVYLVENIGSIKFLTGSYLLGCARNRFAKVLPKSNRNRISINAESSDAKQGGSLAETLHAPEDAFAEMEFDEEYRKALAALTPDERAVFELRFHDDMSYREIADRLTIKRETVNSRLRNARAEMRKHFSKVYDLA